MVSLSQLAQAKKYSKTYRLGLLQAHAFRILKQRTLDILKKYDINTLDWALLGTLDDVEKMTYKKAAETLAVSRPVVTLLCEKLLEKKLIETVNDLNDKRVKYITLSKSGSDFVAKQESTIRDAMKGAIDKTSTRDLLGYVTVLQAIVASEEKEGEKKPYSWFA